MNTMEEFKAPCTNPQVMAICESDTVGHVTGPELPVLAFSKDTVTDSFVSIRLNDIFQQERTLTG